jgi:hypothetical protein
MLQEGNTMRPSADAKIGACSRIFPALVGTAIALLCGTWSAAAQTPPPPYLAAFPNFAPIPTPPFPGDVDTKLKKKYDDAKQFAEVQRLFDLDAWQMFLALNWPTNGQGQPAALITDYKFGPPHWTLWQTSSQIYRSDGKRPVACGPAPNAALEATAQRPAPLLRGLPLMAKPANVDPRSVLLLGNLSAVGNISIVDLSEGHGETNQAFSGPLIDQNGNFVHFDIALDPHEVSYICETGIYTINGQEDFSKKNNSTLTFPSGTDGADWSGSTELKFAWKIIDQSKGDQPDRFFTMTAIIPTADGGTRQVQVGLVGMHIGHKSQSSPQWIWATFEQVDNLVGDTMAHPPIKASFYDPGCQICVPNLDPEVTGDTTTPVQAVRAIPIPGEKQSLNAQAQAALKALGSVWQYYQLIDTQWPIDPTAKPTPWNAGLPDALNNKPGGRPTPVFLTNITMETYFQAGVQAACHQEELPHSVACPSGDVTASNVPKAVADATQVFASESCMGCHSSAGFFKTFDAKTGSGVTWPQLSGDFSWLPAQKACAIAPGSTGPRICSSD